MAKLDRFFAVMKEHAADSLSLVPGQPIALVKGGNSRPMTKEPLTGATIVSLIREVAPGPKADMVGPRAEFSFTYDAPSGAVEIQLAPSNGACAATMRFLFPPAPPAARPFAMVSVKEPELDLTKPREEMERLFRLLHDEGASDLHLRVGMVPMVRRDGELDRLDAPPISAQELELMLQSVMSRTDFATWKADGDADFAYEISGLARFRGNAGMDRLGPVGVFRIIPATIRTAEDLLLSKEIQGLCQLTKGLVLVTGPTGSGKSTTLAALVDLVNRTRSDHIITIEDPIEFVHESKKCVITQRQVGLHTKSFKSALRAALREDPDAVLVGEMRDLETVSIAIETAETGHLVFGTLHTTTAASTLDRIIDQFPADRQAQIRVMLSESLRGVISQVLCRRIGGGRVAAYEVLLSIPAVANLIREGKTFQIPSVMQT
ncbi:MAG: type IV pilus twitching motility protein PilT, partial [Gemmatimonadota bacterium]